MDFDSLKFKDLVRPYIVLADDRLLVDYLREATKRVIEIQSFWRINLVQKGVTITYDGKGNLSGTTPAEGEDSRVFSAAHEGYEFAKIINFIDIESGETILINTGEPKMFPEYNPARTTVVCDFFREGRGGEQQSYASRYRNRGLTGGSRNYTTPVCECALTLTADAAGIPDTFFAQNRKLLQASAMRDLRPFLRKDLAYHIDWEKEYISLSNSWQEKFSPNRQERGQAQSPMGPEGGGIIEGHGHGGGGIWF